MRILVGFLALVLVVKCARAQGCPAPTFGAWADRLDGADQLELFDFAVSRIPWVRPSVRNWSEADRLLWTQMALNTIALEDYQRGWWR